MTCRRVGRLIPLALLTMTLLPAGAADPPEIQAAKEANRARIWARRIFVSVRGEPCDQLAAQIGQQLMTRVRADERIAHRPLSAYAGDCSLAELLEALAAGLGYRLVPYAAAESVHFQLEPGAAPKARPAKPEPGAASRPKTVPAPMDPRLLQKLDLADVSVDDEEGGLPVVLETLAEAASVAILADHAGAATARGTKGASQFLAGLNGLPLHEALDRTARAFNYRWTAAGRWFLFKPVR
jgi:hypothetical protein